MDLAGAVASLATGTYAVTRRAAPSYDATTGLASAGSTSSLSILASVQPLGGRDLLRLPEGERSRQWVAVFTATALRVADAPNGQMADLVSYRGEQHEVQSVEQWDESGNFFKAIAVKVQT